MEETTIYISNSLLRSKTIQTPRYHEHSRAPTSTHEHPRALTSTRIHYGEECGRLRCAQVETTVAAVAKAAGTLALETLTPSRTPHPPRR